MTSSTSMPKKFRVVFFTYHQSAVPLLNYLIEKKCLELVVLPKGFPAKTLSPITKILRQKNLPYLVSQDQIKIAERLNKIKPHLILSFNFPYILKKNILSIPRWAVNFHPGDLPKYRGANVLNWAIINGESKIALTAHFMTEKIDAGNMIVKVAIAIKLSDDAATLSRKIAESAPKLAKQTFSLLKRPNFRGQKQILVGQKYYSRRKPEDGKIDLQRMSGREIINLVRALIYPWPGAYIHSNGKKIVIEEARITKKIKLKPGEIKKIKDTLYLGASDYSVEVMKKR